MTAFANEAAFDVRTSRMSALGVNLSAAQGIVDLHGNVVAHVRTGGILNPTRVELHATCTLYRFGSRSRLPGHVAAGSWWVEKAEFEQLLRFANSHEISVAMAMRVLCLVPPEWSDASLLIRARVVRPLLAWGGLPNSVVTPMAGGHRAVTLLHQNNIAARRLRQLFIPGLNEISQLNPAVSVENFYYLDPQESARGFLYL